VKGEINYKNGPCSNLLSRCFQISSRWTAIVLPYSQKIWVIPSFPWGYPWKILDIEKCYSLWSTAHLAVACFKRGLFCKLIFTIYYGLVWRSVQLCHHIALIATLHAPLTTSFQLFCVHPKDRIRKYGYTTMKWMILRNYKLLMSFISWLCSHIYFVFGQEQNVNAYRWFPNIN